MDINDVPVDQALTDDVFGKFLDLMNANTDKNTYKQMQRMCEIVMEVYKMGYVSGYHQANGDKVLNQISG